MHSWKKRINLGAAQLIALVIALVSFQANATASLNISKDSEQGQYIDQYIKSFVNSKTKEHLNLIDELPQKFNKEGKAIGPEQILALAPYFAGSTPEEKAANYKRLEDAIASGAYIDQSDKIRAQGRYYKIENGQKVIIKLEDPSSSLTRAPVEYSDKAENLVDSVSGFMTTLKDMDSYRSASLETTPWSDSYWPTYQGHLGARYAAASFRGAYDFKAAFSLFFTLEKNRFDEAYKTYSDNSSQAVVDAFDNYMAFASDQTGEEQALNSLSPAEKYDMLMGDSSFTLTRKNWDNAVRTFDSFGEVESWTGLCHGWAPASYMLSRPSKAVAIEVAEGKKITFYPSDIKAYATSLWADSSPPSRFVGSRCNDKKPKTDPETGRLMSQACFDNNPATWHKSVVNQIALAKRSFVMDAVYDFEVWNHPVFAYKYDYFNPLTGERTSSLEEATVDYSLEENRAKDKFRKIREKEYAGDPLPKYLVGISMRVDYTVETEAHHVEIDSVNYDASNSAVYMYDLELSDSGEILGGEWYQNKHPDFLWTPEEGARAATSAERFLELFNWEGNGPVPATWKAAAQVASRRKTPLAVVVESLIERAQ